MIEKFKIVRQGDDEILFAEVEGEKIKIGDINAFIFKEIKDDQSFGGQIEVYNVSHFETGCRIAHDFEKQSAIELAASVIYKDSKVVKKAINFLQSKGIKIPVNQ